MHYIHIDHITTMYILTILQTTNTYALYTHRSHDNYNVPLHATPA
ncbi:hypothetical protein LINPERHAP1_LOCUS8952 [Linum perenne]